MANRWPDFVTKLALLSVGRYGGSVWPFWHFAEGKAAAMSWQNRHAVSPTEPVAPADMPLLIPTVSIRESLFVSEKDSVRAQSPTAVARIRASRLRRKVVTSWP